MHFQIFLIIKKVKIISFAMNIIKLEGDLQPILG
jgi:hypothetical protein